MNDPKRRYEVRYCDPLTVEELVFGSTENPDGQPLLSIARERGLKDLSVVDTQRMLSGAVQA